MPGHLVEQSAQVMCAHAASASPTTPNPRVKVGGQMTVLATGPYTVAGCPFMTGSNPFPCVTGQWITSSVRVKSTGQPLVLRDSQSVCAPTGTPLTIVMTQMRVKAT